MILWQENKKTSNECEVAGVRRRGGKSQDLQLDGGYEASIFPRRMERKFDEAQHEEEATWTVSPATVFRRVKNNRATAEWTGRIEKDTNGELQKKWRTTKN